MAALLESIADRLCNRAHVRLVGRPLGHGEVDGVVTLVAGQRLHGGVGYVAPGDLRHRIRRQRQVLYRSRDPEPLDLAVAGLCDESFPDFRRDDADKRLLEVDLLVAKLPRLRDYTSKPIEVKVLDRGDADQLQVCPLPVQHLDPSRNDRPSLGFAHARNPADRVDDVVTKWIGRHECAVGGHSLVLAVHVLQNQGI